MGHRMASKPRLLPTAKGTFGSPGRPVWLEEMCIIMEENVNKYGEKSAKLQAQPGRMLLHLPTCSARI